MVQTDSTRSPLPSRNYLENGKISILLNVPSFSLSLFFFLSFFLFFFFLSLNSYSQYSLSGNIFNEEKFSARHSNRCRLEFYHPIPV